jgi:hypothetical protein
MTISVLIQNRRGAIVATALVDDEDIEFTSRRWHLSSGYPATGARSERMHSLILGRHAGLEPDHLNGDKLDNRRENLRLVSHAENTQNVRTAKGDMRGVFFDSRENVWYGQVKHNGRKHSTKRFRSASDAQRAVIELRAQILPFADPAHG